MAKLEHREVHVTVDYVEAHDCQVPYVSISGNFSRAPVVTQNGYRLFTIEEARKLLTEELKEKRAAADELELAVNATSELPFELDPYTATKNSGSVMVDGFSYDASAPRWQTEGVEKEVRHLLSLYPMLVQRDQYIDKMAIFLREAGFPRDFARSTARESWAKSSQTQVEKFLAEPTIFEQVQQQQ